MRKKDYKCINGCHLPKLEKSLSKTKSGKYRMKIPKWRYCPVCGAMMPSTMKIIKEFFKVAMLHPSLKIAKRLFVKSEYDAAVREACVVLENIIKEKSGIIDSHGKDLVTKALSFEFDKQTREIKKQPMIALNQLENESQRNEQEGLKMMLMGFFQGPRNLFQHNRLGLRPVKALALILQASFFISTLDNEGSILKPAHWVRKTLLSSEIIENMPKKSDRKLFRKMLKQRKKKMKKELQGCK